MVEGPQKVRVLMVCLGICRSPMAEAVLKHEVSQRQSLKGKFTIEVDSAGTGAYHEGEPADSRTMSTCKKNKIPISCRARKVSNSDFATFDYILAMDSSNLQTLKHRKPSSSAAVIELFGAYDPQAMSGKGRAKEIDDPYYGGNSGFDAAYEQCVRYSRGFLDHLEGKQ